MLETVSSGVLANKSGPIEKWLTPFKTKSGAIEKWLTPFKDKDKHKRKVADTFQDALSRSLPREQQSESAKPTRSAGL